MAKPYKVRILWGDSFREATEYRFATLAELNAFLLGATEAEGWMNWEQVDPLSDGSWPPVCRQCGSAQITINADGYDCECCEENIEGKPVEMKLGVVK